MSTSYGPELARLCKARLGEITDADIAALSEFAERRLVELGVPPSCGEDVTQRALHAVLYGMEKDRGGRKPRLVDVNDKTAFLNYLRGIVSSLLYSMTRTRGFRTTQQWDDSGPSPDAGRPSPANEAGLRDLGEQLFRRLRARAPRRLFPTINAWEAVFLSSDRIPARGHRKYVREVKKLAQEVLLELDGLRQ
jgi:hypothetical protein